MARTISANIEGNVIEVAIHGALEAEDYERFRPQIESLIQKYGKVSLLAEMTDFEGWSAGALWEDVKLDAKHFNHFERLAIVGDSAKERAMALFCKPFTTAHVRYFTPDRMEEARAWVRGQDE